MIGKRSSISRAARRTMPSPPSNAASSRLNTVWCSSGLPRRRPPASKPQATLSRRGQLHLLASTRVRESILLLGSGSLAVPTLHQDRQLPALPGAVVLERARVGQATGATARTRLRKPRQWLPLV